MKARASLAGILFQGSPAKLYFLKIVVGVSKGRISDVLNYFVFVRRSWVESQIGENSTDLILSKKRGAMWTQRDKQITRLL